MQTVTPTTKTRNKGVKRQASLSESSYMDYAPYSPLDFALIEKHALAFATHLKKNRAIIIDLLLTYESYEVVEDEMTRALDLLENLKENKQYFDLRVGDIVAFLPRNQPLYALTCFVLVPSYMGGAVHFRIPHSMRSFLPELLKILDIAKFYPNVHVSNLERLEFLRERSALKVDPATHASLPVTDVVIFTGTPAHADQLRLVFDQRTLFIANGSGHNPLIIAEDADLRHATEAVLTLQLYNQGQDCAAPKSILVHRAVYDTFLTHLHEGLQGVKIGGYEDRSARVGPISDPLDLVRIQEFLIRHRQWLDSSTPGVIHSRTSILEPTVLLMPLREGGNFTELFAPVIVVQVYEDDEELALYFRNRRYAVNAMYVTVYGTSNFVTNMIGKKIDGVVLHDHASYLHNTHLHARGVERGTKPYGGSGRGASSYTVRGEMVCKATLPQREIFTEIAKPMHRVKGLSAFRERLQSYTKIEHRNVEKILHLGAQTEKIVSSDVGTEYIDTNILQPNPTRRYVSIDKRFSYRLLERPNVEHIARLTPTQLDEIRALRHLISRRGELTLKEFTALMYSLPHKPDPAQPDRRARQHIFFQTIYQLLLGKKNGPNLPQFLTDLDPAIVQILLDV